VHLRLQPTLSAAAARRQRPAGATPRGSQSAPSAIWTQKSCRKGLKSLLMLTTVDRRLFASARLAGRRCRRWMLIGGHRFGVFRRGVMPQPGHDHQLGLRSTRVLCDRARPEGAGSGAIVPPAIRGRPPRGATFAERLGQTLSQRLPTCLASPCSGSAISSSERCIGRKLRTRSSPEVSPQSSPRLTRAWRRFVRGVGLDTGGVRGRVRRGPHSHLSRASLPNLSGVSESRCGLRYQRGGRRGSNGPEAPVGFVAVLQRETVDRARAREDRRDPGERRDGVVIAVAEGQHNTSHSSVPCSSSRGQLC